MTDEEWQQYRADYATNHNVYLSDLPEIRAQHDEYPGLSEAMEDVEGPGDEENEETVYPSLTVIEGVTSHESAPQWQVIEESEPEPEAVLSPETEQERLLKLMGTRINNSKKER